jgi:hypothetical protein
MFYNFLDKAPMSATDLRTRFGEAVLYYPCKVCGHKSVYKFPFRVYGFSNSKIKRQWKAAAAKELNRCLNILYKQGGVICDNCDAKAQTRRLLAKHSEKR